MEHIQVANSKQYDNGEVENVVADIRIAFESAKVFLLDDESIMKDGQ